MKEKTLWGITKTYYSDRLKNWLNESKNLWVHESARVPLAVFNNRGEARRALNKKLSYEIKNWGMKHVRRWKYKVEKVK